MKKLSGSGDFWEDIEWEVKLNPELSYETRIALIWWNGCCLMHILRQCMKLRWIRFMSNRTHASQI